MRVSKGQVHLTRAARVAEGRRTASAPPTSRGVEGRRANARPSQGGRIRVTRKAHGSANISIKVTSNLKGPIAPEPKAAAEDQEREYEYSDGQGAAVGFDKVGECRSGDEEEHASDRKPNCPGALKQRSLGYFLGRFIVRIARVAPALHLQSLPVEACDARSLDGDERGEERWCDPTWIAVGEHQAPRPRLCTSPSEMSDLKSRIPILSMSRLPVSASAPPAASRGAGPIASPFLLQHDPTSVRHAHSYVGGG